MTAGTTKTSPTKRPSRAKAKVGSPPPEPEVIHFYAVGDRVSHQHFGAGEITAVQGDKLTIVFEKSGTKVIVDDFVKRRR